MYFCRSRWYIQLSVCAANYLLLERPEICPRIGKIGCGSGCELDIKEGHYISHPCRSDGSYFCVDWRLRYFVVPQSNTTKFATAISKVPEVRSFPASFSRDSFSSEFYLFYDVAYGDEIQPSSWSVWLPMPNSQQSLVQSQHLPTPWNLRGGRWSSVE